jgi:hypothetical protein
MKSHGKPTVRVAVVVAGLLLMMPASLISQAAASPGLKQVLAPLAFFTGNWECSGKFDSSGKTIEAHQSFTPDFVGAWILFRHDDKAPFNYHSLAEWDWDENRKEFVMTVQDSAGGVRLFHSNGWNSAQLQWDGATVGVTSVPGQRFNFERLDDRHFRVSYFTLKNGAWSRVDLSMCSKQ